MVKLSAQQIALSAYKAGFRNNALITATAIALAESSGDTAAHGYNAPTKNCPHGSTDQGLWQINDCSHAEVSPSCAFNQDCAATAAYRISNNGTYFVPWSTFNNGAYKKFTDKATLAAGVIHGLHQSSDTKKSVFHKELGHWKYLSQLTMSAMAGYSPINRENDCGPACLSMLLYHLFDIYLSDDMINVLEAGPKHIGYTSTEQMINYLLRAWNIPSELRVADNANDAYNYAKAQIRRSFAVINLGDSQGNGTTFKHYTVCTGIKSGHVIIADPGIGSRIGITKDEYFKRSYVAQICPLMARA